MSQTRSPFPACPSPGSQTSRAQALLLLRGGVGLEHQPCHMRISSPSPQNKTKLNRFPTRKSEVNSPGLLLSLYPPRPPRLSCGRLCERLRAPGTSGCPAGRRGPGRRAAPHRPAEGALPRSPHTAAAGSVPGPGAGGTTRASPGCLPSPSGRARLSLSLSRSLSTGRTFSLSSIRSK